MNNATTHAGLGRPEVLLDTGPLTPEELKRWLHQNGKIVAELGDSLQLTRTGRLTIDIETYIPDLVASRSN